MRRSWSEQVVAFLAGANERRMIPKRPDTREELEARLHIPGVPDDLAPYVDERMFTEPGTPRHRRTNRS